MEKPKIKNKTSYLRCFISIFFVFYLAIDLLVFRNKLTHFHYLALVFLFIFGIADRFKFIKIPGFVELKDKTDSMDKKLDTIVNKVQQIQSQGLNVYFNPPSQIPPQTETSIQTKPLEPESPQPNNR